MAKAIEIKFSVGGVTQFHSNLRGIQNSVKSLKPQFDLLAKEFYDTEEKQFVAQGAFEGNTKWASLSTLYADWKYNHYGALPILTRKWKLRNSLTKQGADGNVHRMSDMSFEVGTSIKYAWAHQKGYPPRKLPARPPIAFTGDQIKRWNAILTRSLHDKIVKAIAQKYAAT